MIVICYICGEEFEISFDEAELDELDDYVCDDCAKSAIEYAISRN